MNIDEVVEEIKSQYPGSNIVIQDEDGYLEIIVEVEPTADHPEYSRAVIVAGKSRPHFHKRSTEIYRVLRGKMKVAVDGRIHELVAGDEITIKPGQVHSLAAERVWFEAISRPGWTKDDHFLED
ncbi:MAG: cupin domain-containing protein [Candidatus Saccharimonadales bacterium]|nr:cupin domain-containing protein [Candidatus Saccharimonadales bacterium]